MRAWWFGVVLLAGCGSTVPPATTTTVAVTSTTKRDECPTLRAKLVTAKERRTTVGLDDAVGRARVDDAARAARRAGCDVSDLVGPNVGT